MPQSKARRFLLFISLLLVAVLALAACGGGGELETVPEAQVEGAETEADVEADVTDTEVTTETETTETETTETETTETAAVTETETVTGDVAADEETVTVQAEAEVPAGDTTVMTETGTSIVTDTIVVTAVTNVVTEVTVIEDVTTDVDVEVEDTELDIDTSNITESTVLTGDAAAAVAAELGDEAGTTRATTATVGVGMGEAEGVLVSANSLRGYTFEDANGETVGDVANIILDSSTGQISYLVVEYGGFLELGETQIPMPLDAFTFSDDRLIANFNQEDLEAFPEMDDQWFESTAWDANVGAFWTERDLGQGNIRAEGAVPAFVRVEDLINRTVAWGDAQASIEDLLLDLGRGSAKYLLVNSGDLDVDGLYAVPFGAFDLAASTGDELVFGSDFDAADLADAPIIQRAWFEDRANADPQVERDVQTYWGERGFFQDWDMNPDGQ